VISIETTATGVSKPIRNNPGTECPALIMQCSFIRIYAKSLIQNCETSHVRLSMGSTIRL
jgi:hypothetical protein